MMLTDLQAGALGFVAVEAALFPLVWRFWPRAADAPELVRCERCGKPVVLEAATYHRRRCSGVLRSMPVASARRRSW